MWSLVSQAIRHGTRRRSPGVPPAIASRLRTGGKGRGVAAITLDYGATHTVAIVLAWPGWDAPAIGKTVVSSSMIDRVAARLGRALLEVPVGFKWFTDGLLEGSLGFAGEESAGACFLRRDGSVWTTDKDGLILGLLAAEITARTGSNPAAAYDRITSELGRSWYERTDAPATANERARLRALTPAQIAMPELAGEPVRATLTAAPGNGASIGGVKFVADGGWFAARPSGTEDVYKIYAESFRSADHLGRIQGQARDALSEAFAHRAP